MHISMEELVLAMENLDEKAVKSRVIRLLNDGASSHTIMYTLNSGMFLVGKKFEIGEYFLADLVVSGIIYREALDLIDITSKEMHRTIGKVLIGVVVDDIHDIGKDIVSGTLRGGGFEVIDLGTDVSSERFVEAALLHRPDIIALSGAMSFAFEGIRNTIEQLTTAGVREFAKIIAGGNCINKSANHLLNVDGYGDDPVETLVICRELLKINE